MAAGSIKTIVRITCACGRVRDDDHTGGHVNQAMTEARKQGWNIGVDGDGGWTVHCPSCAMAGWFQDPSARERD